MNEESRNSSREADKTNRNIIKLFQNHSNNACCFRCKLNLGSDNDETPVGSAKSKKNDKYLDESVGIEENTFYCNEFNEYDIYCSKILDKNDSKQCLNKIIQVHDHPNYKFAIEKNKKTIKTVLYLKNMKIVLICHLIANI
ncbi:hypothetical protein EDEG_00791 [Edhazardia aedis USNM 41457]|uniref:Uncharacterized protein n=1 Tax=Edhazardia aedis (strain USNM 41457) TaxID=1003232 RepID=J9DBM2_EDHAE|nr:hypothetical protein EDEG_00791 [Edhazardia aedis USNM 41457]|eukprot:EJW05121.1 hypothetical protein EDEG_00791 [Edhazardia aedis USNM 41457]